MFNAAIWENYCQHIEQYFVFESFNLPENTWYIKAALPLVILKFVQIMANISGYFSVSNAPTYQNKSNILWQFLAFNAWICQYYGQPHSPRTEWAHRWRNSFVETMRLQLIDILCSSHLLFFSSLIPLKNSSSILFFNYNLYSFPVSIALSEKFLSSK